MINPPDDLLADLQSALPPEQQQGQSPLPSSSAAATSLGSSHSNGGPPININGHTSPPHDHLYDRTEHPGVDVNVQPERASVASTVSHNS